MIDPGSIQAFAVNLIYFLVTLLICRVILIYLNWSLGIKFGELLREKINHDPIAASLYFSARWIGLCIIAAAFL